MIIVNTIEESGGACPYELVGTTNNGEWFYLRYRNGMLRYVVKKHPHEFDLQYDYSKKVGEDLDGWPHDELFKKELSGLVQLPENFIFQTEYYSKES